MYFNHLLLFTQLREHFRGKKYLPTDIRYKKTRAMRRALSKHDAAIKCSRIAKRDAYFPRRRYALKA